MKYIILIFAALFLLLVLIGMMFVFEKLSYAESYKVMFSLDGGKTWKRQYLPTSVTRAFLKATINEADKEPWATDHIIVAVTKRESGKTDNQYVLKCHEIPPLTETNMSFDK